MFKSNAWRERWVIREVDRLREGRKIIQIAIGLADQHLNIAASGFVQDGTDITENRIERGASRGSKSGVVEAITCLACDLIISDVEYRAVCTLDDRLGLARFI